MKGDVEELRVVAEQHFSRLRRCDVVARLNLNKVFENGCRLPNFVIELAVDDRWLLELLHLHRVCFFRRQGERALRCSIAGVRSSAGSFRARRRAGNCQRKVIAYPTARVYRRTDDYQEANNEAANPHSAFYFPGG